MFSTIFCTFLVDTTPLRLPYCFFPSPHLPTYLTSLAICDVPLYETGVVDPPTTHNVEDPPRVVRLECVLDAGALVERHGEAGVASAVGDGHDAVLV